MLFPRHGAAVDNVSPISTSTSYLSGSGLCEGLTCRLRGAELALYRVTHGVSICPGSDSEAFSARGLGAFGVGQANKAKLGWKTVKATDD